MFLGKVYCNADKMFRQVLGCWHELFTQLWELNLGQLAQKKRKDKSPLYNSQKVVLSGRCTETQKATTKTLLMVEGMEFRRKTKYPSLKEAKKKKKIGDTQIRHNGLHIMRIKIKRILSVLEIFCLIWIILKLSFSK